MVVLLLLVLLETNSGNIDDEVVIMDVGLLLVVFISVNGFVAGVVENANVDANRKKNESTTTS